MEVSSIIHTLKRAKYTKQVILGLLAACLLANIWARPALGDWPPDQKGQVADAAQAVKEVKTPVKTMQIIVTAYSSTVAQTDDSPYITASNTLVRDGIVASNLLPLARKLGFRSLTPTRFMSLKTD